MKDSMDPSVFRLVHVRTPSGSHYACGRLVRSCMWGSQDIEAGKVPSCLLCIGAIVK
jgi:hypothetical protein